MYSNGSRKTTQTRMFCKDIQRLNALKARLQDKFPFNLSHPFLIMMLLDEWEKGHSLTATGSSKEQL